MFAAVKSRGKGSAWNFWFRVVVPKRGTNKAKQPSQPLPPSCRALIWVTLVVGLICNQRIGQNFSLHFGGSPSVLHPEQSHGTFVPEQHHSSLSRGTAQPCKAKGFSSRYLHANRPHQRTGWTCLESQDGEEGAGAEAEPFCHERKWYPQQRPISSCRSELALFREGEAAMPPGAQKCHHGPVLRAHPAPRQPSTTPGALLGAGSKSWVRISGAAPLCAGKGLFPGLPSLQLRGEVEHSSPGKQNTL